MPHNVDVHLQRSARQPWRPFRRRPEPTVEVVVEAPGYDVEMRALDAMFRERRISRQAYEMARRQLQHTYRMGILPDSAVREA